MSGRGDQIRRRGQHRKGRRHISPAKKARVKVGSQLYNELIATGIRPRGAKKFQVRKAYSYIVKISRHIKMMQIRPYLLEYLLRLGVVRDKAEEFTLTKAYNVLYKLLREKAGPIKPGGATDRQLLHLFMVGIEADNTLTKEQARILLNNIRSQTNPKLRADGSSVRPDDLIQ